MGPPSPAGVTRNTVVRGGTVPLRDPAMLSLLGTPFDPYPYFADVRPPATGGLRINLPNLAIFLWRLAAFQPPVTSRSSAATGSTLLPGPTMRTFGVRFDVHPLGIRCGCSILRRYRPDPSRPWSRKWTRRPDRYRPPD